MVKRLIVTIIIIILIFFILFFVIFSSKKEKKEIKVDLPQSLTHGTIVFLDTSVSMRGYFRTSNRQATQIQRFLQQRFRNIISKNSLYPIYLSRFGEEIGNPEQLQNSIGNMFVFSSSVSLDENFSGSSTDLIGVFRRGEFGSYSVSIIITDGIQADSSGSDIGEMIRAIESKIGTGLHIYLIGIKSEFDGYIYPECPNDYGLRTPFYHTGRRPVYIWIAAADETIGSNIVRDIITEFRKIAPDNTVKTVSLTDLKLPSINSIGLDADASDYRIIPRGQDKFELRLKNSLQEQENLDIPIRLESNLNSNEADIWRLRMQLEPQSQWIDIIKDENDWVLSLKNNVPGSSLFGGGNKLKIKAIASPDRQQWWWKQWSTDCDSKPADADKTIHLNKLGEKFIEPRYGEEYVVKTLNLEVVK